MSQVSLTRQPIFDLRGDVVGFDVRFRPLTAGGDPLSQSLFSGALETIGRGKPVWVTLDESHLKREVLLTPVGVPVVAIVASALEPTEAHLAQLNVMHGAGVFIALDEFAAPSGADDPVMRLLAHASYVRVDAAAMSREAFAAACAAAKRAGIPVVADRVSDADDFAAASKAGAALFLGAHFSHPTPLPRQALPASTLAALHVLSLARDPDTSERDLERAISGDPTLTVQLLRVVNSAAIGARGVSSVGHALRLAGRTTLIRWLALAAFASRADQSGVERELADQAVRRAYMAQFIAEHAHGIDPQTAFLVGMFSMIDAVFRIPLAEVLERIAVAADVREALLDRTGLMARLLDFIEAYEMAQWELSAEVALDLHVNVDDAAMAYGRAIAEVEALLTQS